MLRYAYRLRVAGKKIAQCFVRDLTMLACYYFFLGISRPMTRSKLAIKCL